MVRWEGGWVGVGVGQGWAWWVDLAGVGGWGWVRRVVRDGKGWDMV